MKLNLEYKREVQDCLTESENRMINQYINLYTEEEYEKILHQEPTYENILALSEIRNNIINWYPFQKNATILQIGANLGEITGELCKKAKNVIAIEPCLEKAEAIAKRLNNYQNLELIVGDFEKVAEDEFQKTAFFQETKQPIKFDYIIIIEMEKQNIALETILHFAKKVLKDQGTILLSIQNELAVSKMNGVENINCESHPDKGMTKNQLKQQLDQFSEFQYRFYYPLPNDKLPNIILTDDHLPSSESILRDITIYHENAVQAFDERQWYRDILKENEQLFSTFANTFLIEVSKTKIDHTIQYICFGNTRKPEFRLKTIICKDVVKKEAIHEKAQKHLMQMKENIEKLQEAKIHTLDRFEEGKIYSKLITEQKSYDKILLYMFQTQGIDAMVEAMRKFQRELDEKLQKSNQIDHTVFEKYHLVIPEGMKKELNFIQYGIFDLIFQNCFLIDDKFYFYDQEWVEPDLPLEFIMYRAVFYLCNSRKEIDMLSIFKQLNIEKYINLFEKLENILQSQIKDSVIWKAHAQSQKTIKAQYDTQVHLMNIKENELREQMRLQDIQFQTLKEEYDKKNDQVQQKNQEIKELTEKIEGILDSRSWKLLQAIRKMIPKKK